MNYVILNEKKSTLIKGLLIQSLPPITKPLIRTKTETIDGRDGDIVTKLGYSAYDKPMSIGLFGDFNIDEVIEYFNSEGTVIFSNEPDKFYKYQILEQIDFERLIRFRTATVTFHVQPFKYSATDDSYIVRKNQLSLRKYNDTRYDVTVKESDGVITVKGEASWRAEFYLPIKAMTLNPGSYTVRAKATGSNADHAKIRIISSEPVDSGTLGGQSLTLGADVTLSATLSEEKTFNYLYILLESGVEYDISLDLQVLWNDWKSISVFNRGNYFSKPKLTIYGANAISLSLNGSQILQIALAQMGFITIDAADMNAYKGDDLMNRYVTGNYNDLNFKIGANELTWTGDIESIRIEDESRWI